MPAVQKAIPLIFESLHTQANVFDTVRRCVLGIYWCDLKKTCPAAQKAILCGQRILVFGTTQRDMLPGSHDRN